MKLIAQRVLEGANFHADHPVWRLTLRGELDVPKVRAALAGLVTLAADDTGALIGALACALQRQVGALTTWHAAARDADGDWVIVHAYDDPAVGKEAGLLAILVAEACHDGRSPGLDAAVARLRDTAAENAPPPSQRALVDAARRAGIPVMRRGPDHHQLGWGNQQEHLWGSVTGRTSGLGHDIANDHERTVHTLADTGIPVPTTETRKTLTGTEEAARAIGYPVTIKPLRGRGGVTHVHAPGDLEAAYDRAKKLHRWVAIQRHIPGTPYTVLVVGGRVIGAVARSTGRDVTDTLHPAVALACRRAGRLAGIDTFGVDLVATTLDVPLEDTGGHVVSLDPQPDITQFVARGAADAVIEGLFAGGDGRIPLVAVTGTNGKTTTVRLISHILKYAGGRVGMACTGAVEVENQVILRGDYSGPSAARTVLREPGISHAVCEVARGGILRRGIGYDHADVGVLLNVASDHLGQGGIDTLDDLARLKGVVVRNVRPGGTVVLNADDPITWALRHSTDRTVIPFTLDPHHPDVAAHLAADPTRVCVTMQGDAIVLRRGPAEFRVADIVDIPVTLEGAAMFNVQNAMAATAVAYALGVREEDCRAGLHTFNPSPNQLPGRMNLIRLGGVKVLLDYGHNVPALNALATALPRLATGRRINVANTAGNRRDVDLVRFGTTLAGMYDRIYLSDPDPRRREVGVTASHIAKGILDAGFDPDELIIELDEAKAFRLALAESRPGDLVVLQADDVDGAIDLCRTIQRRLEAGESPADLNRDLIERAV